jgi:hypothetical protein
MTSPPDLVPTPPDLVPTNEGLDAMTISTASTAALAGTWAPTADLTTAAAWYGQHDGAVPLGDSGKVLLAGGADAASNPLGLAYFIDSKAQNPSWQPAGTLHTPRRLHSITLLANGKVLVAGGLGSSSASGPALRGAEVYDPEHNTWDTTGELVTARWGHSATLLPDGKVLVAGGTAVRSGQTTKALTSAELYDPAARTWSEITAMTDARTGHVALPLKGGKVLVIGGSAPVGTPDDPALAFCELYDSKTGWTPTGSLFKARRHHRAALLSDTAVLVTGGAAPGASPDGPFDPFSQRTAERFDLTAGTWTALPDMPSGRAFHRALPLGQGKVLIAGGTATDRDESGYRSALVYDDAARTSSDGPWTPAAGLGTGRWAFAAAVLPDGRVLVTGGVARSGLAAADPSVTELTQSTEIFTGSGS